MEIKYPGSLHNHTEYSNARLRDSISRSKDLINQALSLGQEVIAFTEHELISNAVKIEKEYKKIKENNPDFKVILGNEIYLCRDGLNAQNFQKGQDDYYHFILLAKDAEGHRQIRELSTRAWMRSYVTGKMRRCPTYYQDIIEIIGNNPGHVIGSTACLGGFLASKILQWYNMDKDEFFSSAKDTFYEQIKNWIKRLDNLFGHNNFYLEMQPSNFNEQIIVNKELLKLANSLNIPYIITNDSHYTKKEDAPIHEAFLKSQDGDREVASFYTTTYLMDDEELRKYFSYFSEEDINQAYHNILNIKNNCEDYTLLKPLKIPSLKWKSPKGNYSKEQHNKYFNQIPWLKTFYDSDFDGDRLMVDLIIDKFESDCRLQNEQTYNEINQNLEATWISSEVNKAHWSAYFLNLQYSLDVCWNAGTIVGPGRGSGVGFLLLYFLDIIQINSLWETTRTFGWRLTKRVKASSAWRQA